MLVSLCMCANKSIRFYVQYIDLAVLLLIIVAYIRIWLYDYNHFITKSMKCIAVSRSVRITHSSNRFFMTENYFAR